MATRPSRPWVPLNDDLDVTRLLMTDRWMLESANAVMAPPAMLVLNEDANREHGYGSGWELRDTRGGTFTQALQGKDDGVVIDVKNDWKRIFAFEP
jgi:hypothetical protein